MGLKFKNELNKKGRITAVRLFLHKTDSELNLTTLEITFYRIDSMTKLPLQKLNKEKIIYRPKTKRRETVRIDLKNYNLPFPEEGVLVAVRWMPMATRNQNVGPSLRQTNYREQITYSRYNGGEWYKHGSHSKKSGLYTNAMIGLEVYIKRRTVD